nr:AP-4 complex subunit epsilon-1-like [Lytechinus pictus]
MEKALSYSGLIAGPRNMTISSGFYSLLRAIKRANSKGEEERIVQKELELIRQNLSQPDISMKKMKEFMVRLIYCEMLGQPATFSYIHAIKMAQQGVLLNKRVGYLGVSLFLNSQHELILLLINTIQKDLNSTNVLDVCGGLTACCNLIGPEMLPVVLPLIEQNVQHQHEIVRRKAVLVLHSFVVKCPHLIGHMKEYFQQALCDRSPGVMTAALHIYQTLVKEHPEHHKSLVRPLTSILKQVVQRKLSQEYEFRGVPAPWLQIQILKMLARLGFNDPKTSLMMYDVLEEVLESSNTLSMISLGVQYECIMTIAKIHPKLDLLKKASVCITRFLKSQSNNLRYLGVNALGVIHKVHPEFSIEHQMTVVECLEDEDPTIKQATLNLLYEMCNTENISVILDKVLDHLNSGVDELDHSEHIHRMISLAHQFHPSIRWYVVIIVKILHLHRTNVLPNTINNLITSIQRHEPKDSGMVSYLVEEMLTLSKQAHLREELVKLIAWVLGEYSHSEKSTVPGSEAMAGLSALLSKPMSPATKSCVVTAITKVVLKSGLAAEDVTKVAQTAQKNVHLKQVSCELEVLSSHPELITALPSVNKNQFDWTLSFLDDYVSDALGNGAAPYKPKQQRSAEKHNSPEVMRPFLSGLNFRPYESHSASVMTPTESSSSVPANNQESSSWSPSQSLSSGATGNSVDTELATRPSLKTEGIQKVWSQTGYSRANKDINKKRQSPKRNSNVQPRGEESRTEPPVQMSPVTAVGMTTAHPAESEEEKRKQELAKALFGSARKQPEQNELPQFQMKSSSTAKQSSLKERGSPEAFADYCTEEGLRIRGDMGRNILLDIGIQDVEDERSTPQGHSSILHGSNRHSDSKTIKHDMMPRDVGDLESKSNHGVSLLDDDQTLPSLPDNLETCLSSQVAEELVFDTNLRLTMRRVWQNEALALVFFVSALTPVEEVRITLDVPSNMKCMIDSEETNVIVVPPSGVSQAKLMCNVPAANMSLGGELTFKDPTKTLKRLFFHAPIHIKDLLRSKEMTTEEFGKLWTELSLDQRLIQDAKGWTITSVMNKMTSLHLFPVEIIGEEGILATSLLQSSICLIHIKLNSNKLDIWVKTRSKLLSQILAKKCASVIEEDLKK